MADYSSNKKRVREDESSELDTLEVKKIRDDLLGILDESYPDAENQDLDSVMKSLEKEISVATDVVIVDFTSNSGEPQPDLGYLLEASDDDLGLPPPPSSYSSPKSDECEKNDVAELVRVDSDDSVNDVKFWGFGEQTPNYDSFELGTGDSYTEYSAVNDGLFEYPNACFDYYGYL